MTNPAEQEKLQDLAEQLKAGTISVYEFTQRIQLPQKTADVESARVDLDRRRRCGYPEVVYGPGKTIDALRKIIGALQEAGEPVLVTRVSTEQAEAITTTFPKGQHNAVGRTFRLDPEGARSNAPSGGHVPVVTAGTSDLPVAEEALETLLWMGCRTELVVDVGVAGPHRLPEQLPRLAGADAVVVVAGMEGALPSVVGGYVDVPVVAVPTSVGYGANFGGLSALLGMLNSCAANVTVVNIDAGFKAGYVAGLIASRAAQARHQPPAQP